MKGLLCFTAACLLACCATAATPKRVWKTGILLETSHTRDPEPRDVTINNNLGPGPTLVRRRGPLTWQEFRIEDGDYRYVVRCPLGAYRTPNVTVNGPIKYAMEKGRFYILDEDGKEWEMAVLEKALIHAAPAPPRD
jgi:hypothetical protein